MVRVIALLTVVMVSAQLSLGGLQIQKAPGVASTGTVDAQRRTQEPPNVRVSGAVPDRVGIVFQCIAAILTVGTVMYAAKSAKAAKESVQATRLAAEGQLFLELMREYATREMRDDVRLLCEWAQENDKNLANEELRERAQRWIEDLNAKHEKADKIDLARRHIISYFDAVLRLWDSKYVGDTFAAAICSGMSKRIVDIIESLGTALIEDIGKRNKDLPKDVEERVARLRAQMQKLRDVIKGNK